MTIHAPTGASARGRKPGPVSTGAVAAMTATLAVSLLAGCSGGAEEKPPPPTSAAPSQSASTPAPSSPPPPTKTSEPPAPNPRPAFAPYVDTLLKPSYDLLRGARETGVKEYNLAFVSPGGGCVPKWGGRQQLAANPVARQAAALRAKGGDIRVSFGGQSGHELARVCGSVGNLVRAYDRVIDAYDLTKADFDIEGPALTDTKANTLRARAIARLQREHPDLDVSFTLPVRPSGLNPQAVAVLENAKKNGARVSSVNIMAMDFGSYYDDDMGEYAITAATATQKQIKKALGIRRDAEAWKAVAVTPMIGVNDVEVEVFSPADAAELKRFADKKGIGRLSMWSVARDKPCPEGVKSKAMATCSSVDGTPGRFAKAFTG